MGVDESQEIGLLLVTDREIRKYNRHYLRHDRATDVIAFEMKENDVLGDIMISLDRARCQAKAMGHTLFREVQTLAVHGLLHLVGYRDKKKKDRDRMWKKMDSLLALVEKP